MTRSPRVHAHRGFAGRFPENTVAAARAAAHHGADFVEVDVAPCADGDVVVFHDTHLHATDESRGITDAHGTVSETARETVLGAEVLGSGETVPTLAALVDALSGTDTGLNVELKRPGVPDVSVLPVGSAADTDARRRRWEPFVEDVLAVLDGFEGDLLLSSFDPSALAAAARLAPAADRAVLFASDPVAALETARDVDAVAVHPPVDHVVWTPDRDRRTDVDVVALANEADLSVNVWTVRTWYEAAACRRAGVDGIIADYPDLLGGVDTDDTDTTA